MAAPYRFLAEADKNNKVVSTTDCVVTDVIVANLSAETRAVKLYNLAVEATLASSVPVAVFQVPANDTKSYSFPKGFPFSKGLTHVITKKAADANEENTAAGDVSLTILTS